MVPAICFRILCNRFVNKSDMLKGKFTPKSGSVLIKLLVITLITEVLHKASNKGIVDLKWKVIAPDNNSCLVVLESRSTKKPPPKTFLDSLR